MLCYTMFEVADLDLWLKGGGGSHPDSEISGGWSQFFFSALQASVWSKNKGGASPGSTHGLFVCVFFFLD